MKDYTFYEGFSFALRVYMNRERPDPDEVLARILDQEVKRISVAN